MTGLIARCLNVPPCQGFEVVCNSETHKTTVEQRHMTTYHADAVPSDEIADRMWDTHIDERDVIVLAIETAAARHGGHVDPNYVRGIIPAGVTPQMVGVVYRKLKRRGRLRVDGSNVNTDTKGRNVGKHQDTYVLVPDHDRSVTA